MSLGLILIIILVIFLLGGFSGRFGGYGYGYGHGGIGVIGIIIIVLVVLLLIEGWGLSPVQAAAVVTALPLAALVTAGDAKRPRDVAPADIRDGLVKINNERGQKVRPTVEGFSSAIRLRSQPFSSLRRVSRRT